MRNRARLLAVVVLLLACVADGPDSLGQTAQADQSAPRRGSKPKRAPKRKRKMNKPTNTQPPRAGTLPTGLWGGDHISLEATPTGARLEFDCAHGRIEQAITLDADDTFAVAGVYVQERGGPVRSDEQPAERTARYAGRLAGKTLTLTITLTDKQQSIGTYTLVHGQSPNIFKCL